MQKSRCRAAQMVVGAVDLPLRQHRRWQLSILQTGPFSPARRSCRQTIGGNTLWKFTVSFPTIVILSTLEIIGCSTTTCCRKPAQKLQESLDTVPVMGVPTTK